MAVDLGMKNDRSRLMEYYNRRRKRATKSKPPVHEIILKKDNGFRFSEYCRRRKFARKSKAISPPREATLRFVLKKRKQEPSSDAVLEDSELDSRVYALESASGAWGYSEKKQGIEESLARICSSAEALRGCGRLDNYEKLGAGAIGSGAYGAVYRARDTRTGEIVAVKEELEGLSVPTLREIDIMRSLGGRHRGIVGFKEVVAADASDGVYIVMEYAEYDLHRYMKEAEGYFTPSDVKETMLQLVEGVKFLHHNGVMHRDLKPSNILVDGKGVLKICDFGQSRRIDTTAGAGAGAGLYSPHVGTGWYRAPELLRGEKAYSEAVDMWAVGCVMAEMLLRCRGGWEAGRLEAICRMVGDGYERLRSEVFPSEVVGEPGFDLLKRLLCFDPSKRITAEEALTHIWFQE